MSEILITIGSEAEERLNALAARQGNSIAETIQNAVTMFLESAEGEYRPVGEPNQDSLEALAEAKFLSNQTDGYSYDEYMVWMKQVQTEIETENSAESDHASH